MAKSVYDLTAIGRLLALTLARYPRNLKETDRRVASEKSEKGPQTNTTRFLRALGGISQSAGEMPEREIRIRRSA